MCDVTFHDNSLPLYISKDQFEGFSDSNDDSTSIDDDSFSIDDIDYVEASPPDSELVILEVVEIVIPEWQYHYSFIPPGINEADFDHEEDIRLVERLLYDNSSPRPLEEFNSDAIIESFSPFPIPVEDNDSLMEEIDLFLTSDESMPPGIENDDYDYEGDILFLKELLSNDSPSLHENESFHFDVPSSPRPPAKPPDDGIYFEPDTGVFTKVVDDISDNSTRELYVHVPNVLPTLPTISSMFDTLLLFTSENEDKVYLLSHRGFKTFLLSSKSPVMIFGGDIPILDFSIALDFEASRARGFVLRSLELQILSFIMGIQYPNLID
ncbi:hypothetical protein Tco_0097879 [Tanacetum coccineum]